MRQKLPNDHGTGTEKPQNNEFKSVIVRTATSFSNNALSLLNKGYKFKITPRDLTDATLKLRVASERLSCAIRYGNPIRPYVDPREKNYKEKPTIYKEVLKHFDKKSLSANG